MPDRKLSVVVTGDTRGLERAFGRTSATAKVFGSNVERAGLQADKSVKSFRNLGAVFAGGFAAQIALGQIKASVAVASNLAEQTSKSRQVFGEFSNDVEKFAQTSGRSFGIARDQAIELASTFGALFRPLGLSAKQAADQSVKLTQLGADLASFYNTDVKDALDAIRSGLVGQVEPLRRYGVELSAARVQALALADTGKRSATELTNQEKVLARIKLLFRDTTLAQGDFQRTSGGLANQTRILSAELRDLEGNIGTVLIPTLAKLTKSLNDTIEGGVSLAESVKHVTSEIAKRDPGVGFIGRFAGQFKDAAVTVVKYTNPITGSFERTIAALKLLGIEFDRTSVKAGGFADALSNPLFNFQVPKAPGGKAGPPGFGDPGFKPKGFQFVTGLGPSAQIALEQAQRTGNFQKQLAALARQKRILEAALGQAGLSNEDQLGLERELTGVVNAQRAIRDQIQAAAKQRKEDLQQTAKSLAAARLAEARNTPSLRDDIAELIRQRNDLRKSLRTKGLSASDKADLRSDLAGIVADLRGVYKELSGGLKEAREGLRNARIDRLDLIQDARDVARRVRDARENLQKQLRIGGTVGIRSAREELQDAQLARRRLRLQGVTFTGAAAAGGTSIGNINIRINSNQDPVVIAQKVLAELRKKRGRGTPSPRGRAPGEHIGGV